MFKKIFLLTICALALLGSVDQNDYDTYIKIDNNIKNKIITLNKNRYKILTFSKRISDIRVSNSGIVGINFEDTTNQPLTQIKVLAKKIGVINLLITFFDGSTKQISFKITQDIQDIKDIIKTISPTVQLVQIDSSIILKGEVKTNKLKDKILLVLKESLPKAKVVDLLKVVHPDKMVRIKLYVAQIDNDKGEELKNHWNFTGNSGTTSTSVTMLDAVTLTGGLSVMATKLGSKFSAGSTLNYIKKNNAGRVLDETTLITLENQSSDFVSGGTLLIETSSTSKDGQPISGIKEIPHGLTMKLTVKEIINDEYINLEIETGLSNPEWSQKIGDIPSTTNKSIKTKIIVKNKNTLVLGGLIKTDKTKTEEKIPLLGDIPLLGFLFRSTTKNDSKNELVFFITPTIIDNNTPTQLNELKKTTNKIVNMKK